MRGDFEAYGPSYHLQAFPVPGTYHFRFLKNVGSHIVWLDVTDDSSALPTHQGSIFIKATRISAPPGPVATSTGEFTPTPAATFAPAPNGAAAAAPSNVSPPAKAPKPVLEKRTSEKLLKFDDDVVSPVNTSNAGNALPPVVVAKGESYSHFSLLLL